MSDLDSENAIDSDAIQLEESCRCFSLSEIQSATNNFDDALLIGIGGFGKVYKGSIDNGATIVAVKRLKVESNQGGKEFWAEVNTLSMLRHNHIVSLIGYCNDCQEMILVYEYIARGTLANHLYNSSREESGTGISYLPWERRVAICIGAARGLNYLHAGTDQIFIHRDVKSTNILLDDNWVAKVSDFGLSKEIANDSITYVSTNVRGSFGYFDPNYFLTGRLTKKSDVYSFGVVLLEVLCGRPPVDTRLEEEQVSLLLWTEQWIKKGKLDRIIDPSLSRQISPRCLKYFVELTRSCLQKAPKERPKMAEVVGALELALAGHQKEKTDGIIPKLCDGIGFLSKGMSGWLRETTGDNFSSSNGSSEGLHLDPHSISVTHLPYHISLANIRSATNDFSEGLLIYGSRKVYRVCVCIDGKVLDVAIKRLNGVTLHEWDEVRPKIELRSLLCHPYIVSLIGFCYEKHELILVYDYMANGSLQDHLNQSPRDPLLTWKKRLEICIDVARGLQYLHAGAEHEILPYNIKPSNILLNKEWAAKLQISSFVKLEIPFGTRTCLFPNPKWFNNRPRGKTIQERDVYSFGVLLLDVLVCKKAMNTFMKISPTYYSLSLFDLFENILNIKAIDYVIDPGLIGKIAPESLEEFVKLALSCMSKQGIQRPSMDCVVERLLSTLGQHEIWLTRNKIDNGRDFHGFSYEEVFSRVGELVRACEQSNAYIEGRWGLLLLCLIHTIRKL